MKIGQRPEDGQEHGRPVEIHIEKLVLHGFAPSDRHRIARAVRRELARRFRQGGVPESVRDSSVLASIDTGTIHIPQGAAPWTAGTRIGAAIYRGLQQQGLHAASPGFGQSASGGPAR